MAGSGSGLIEYGSETLLLSDIVKPLHPTFYLIKKRFWQVLRIVTWIRPFSSCFAGSDFESRSDNLFVLKCFSWKLMKIIKHWYQKARFWFLLVFTTFIYFIYLGNEQAWICSENIYFIYLGNEQAWICSENAEPVRSGAGVRHICPGCSALPLQGILILLISNVLLTTVISSI